MTRLLCDDDFDGHLLHGLRLQCPDWEFSRVQDIGLGGEDGADDPMILEWAAANGLVVLTRDRNTMTAHARNRLAANEPMPGLIVIKASAPFAQVIEDIRLLIECGPALWDSPIVFVPLR
jgi:hypothetical protein